MASNINFSDVSLNIENTIQNLITNKIGREFKKEKTPLDKFLSPAPNIIEWISRPEFLNFIIEDEDTGNLRSIHNHYGQFQAVRDLFELLCPICSKPEDKDCWNKTRESLESQPLLVWNSSIKDDECPRCSSTRAELLEGRLFNGFDTMLLIAGMRSAKSTTSGLIASYVEHRLLSTPNPQGLFGQAPNQLFEVSFIASTARQAEKTVYELFCGIRENSPWIQNYIKTLRTMEKYKGELYEAGSKKIIKYNHINVLFESLTSNSSGIAGGTRLAVFLDELSRFDTTESKRSGQEIYRVSNQGLKTIRSAMISKVIPNCFGMLCITTSPISINDYAMRLGQKASNLSKMFYLHKSTWEFNPYQPKENFIEDFKVDPSGAERDFGANPPLAANPFIDDPGRFLSCIDPSLTPTVTFLDTYPKDPLGKEYVGKQVQFCKVDHTYKKVIVADAGKQKDSFALACAHGEYRPINIGEKVEYKWVTVYDWVLTVRPTMVPKRIVYFDSAEQIIKEIDKKQKIEIVRFDQWNSESIVQTLRFSNIDTDYLSIGTVSNYYIQFLREAYEGRVKMLPPLETDIGKDPYTEMSDQGRAIHELTHLEKSLDGKKIDHKNNGEHNDLAVVVVGCHYLVQSELQRNIVNVPIANRENTAVQHSTGKVARFSRW